MMGKKILWFFFGAACFILSQPLLRLPILEHLQQSTDFILAYTLNPMSIGILIALSAGVFEEGFRFLFKLFLMRPEECGLSQPIIFGLGHGITEALILLAPAFVTVPFSQLGLAILERVLAIILHVTLTIVVWNGFQKKHRILYLLIAIAIHGLVDALIPIFLLTNHSVLMVEVALAGIDILMLGYSYYSRKYYIHGGHENENFGT